MLIEKPEFFAWGLNQMVRKKRGSTWRGVVAGFYSTALTPEGYVVESLFEPDNVQVYPVQALEEWHPDVV